MTTQTQPVAEEKKYFNLRFQGIGYLNNVRMHTRHRQTYLKVTVAALQGPVEKADYLYIDCTVVGTEAKQLISQCAQEINNSGTKVLACFTLNDLWVFSSMQHQSENRGLPTTRLSSSLLSLSMIKINGEVMYAAPPKESTSYVDSANAAQTSNTLDTTDEPETAYDSDAIDIGDPTDSTEDPTVAYS